MTANFDSENITIDEAEEETNDSNKEDENRFNILCCNVINCMVLVQNSHSELLEFKSMLLKEKIAPSVLVKLSLISGKIFRSISDLHNPLGELIRLVRVYSEPWEKKSEALRKLHKDYDRKAGQLNLALKKLSKQNEEAKRITRKETLQNWEYLFTRAQLSRSHGRRWKYRMFEFKLKAQDGIDNLQDYFQQLLDEDDGVKEEVKQIQRELSSLESKNKKSRNESMKSTIDDISLKNVDENLTDDDYEESDEDKEQVSSPEPIQTTDVSIGTTDQNFLQTLVMRIYNPKGVEMYKNLRCRILYGDKVYETNELDKSQQAEEEETRIENEINEAFLLKFPEPVKSKGGLIGRRKNQQIRLPEKSVEQIRKEQAEKKIRSLARNEEVRILIPGDVCSGINKDNSYQSIKIILFTNEKKELKVAQATIDLDEIQGLDLQIFKEFVYQGDMVTPPPTTSLDDKPFPNLEPMTFPLYEYQDKANVNDSSIKMGQLPIGCFWSRKESPRVLNRSTEMLPINRLVEELTGINLDLISKEQLTKETTDKSVSPRSMTPLPDTILKSDLEVIQAEYEEKIRTIQESYESQISELLEIRERSLDKKIVRPRSVYHKDCAVSPIFPYRAVPRNKKVSKPQSSKSRDTLSIGDPDDQEEVLYFNDEHERYENEKNFIHDMKLDLPDNFLERMSFYSEMTTKNKDKLALKVKAEIAKAIEERLAELYRLHDDLTEEDVSLALADMCLPAMFMPFANSSGTVYNPRAHQYFHPNGLKNLRISQAPSIFKLPPIKHNQLSVLNLFDIANQMQITRFEKDVQH